MLWSVTLEAAGDREVTREEVVELADGVAKANGVASGLGAMSYGAQVYVEAPDRDEAITVGTDIFRRAADGAGLPPWPLSRVEAISEDEDREADQDGWAEWEIPE